MPLSLVSRITWLAIEAANGGAAALLMAAAIACLQFARSLRQRGSVSAG